MNNIIRTKTIEIPITNLWNKFKNVIVIAQKHNIPTEITSKRFSQPWFNQEYKRAVRKKSDDIESLIELKNRKTGKIFKKQQ